MKKVLITLVVILLIGSGVIGYFGWQYYQKVATLEEMRDQLRTENNKLTAENMRLTTEIGDLQTAKQTLTEANLALSSQLTQSEQKKNEYLGAMQWWNRQYKAELNENTTLAKNIETLRKEVERLKKENETLLAENKRLQEQYNSLLTSKQGLENQVASLDQSLDNLEEEKIALAQEIAKTKTDLTKSEAEGVKLQATANELDGKLQEALSHQGNLEEEIKTSRVAMDALKQNEARLKASLDTLKKAQSEKVSADILLLEQKKNFVLTQEFVFRSTIILVATSNEKGLERKAKEEAKRLLVFMAYRSDEQLFPEAERAMVKIHMQENVESTRLLHRAWLNWTKARQEFLALHEKISKHEGVG